jgi:CelD/BcsL family acetyltransferase involved in cellulose biosynthesis
MLEVSEVEDAASLAALEPEWQALAAANPASTPFQSFEWCATWWKHHGKGKLWVLVARDNGVAVGLMPLVITRYRSAPLRQVRWMGAPLSDYQELIGPPADAARCATAFLAHLHAHRARWDVCDFNDLRDGGALAATPHEQLRTAIVFHRMCPVVPLEATWETFVKSLGKNMRANVGRRRRQLEKAYRAEFDLAAPETVQAAMEDLFRLHNTRWQKRGASGAFAGPKIQAFHHEVARKFLARGWLRLHRLRLDGETKAAFYCFHQGARTYYYLSGFDLSVSKFSPGNVLMAEAIGRAIADGAREFDLLRGDETYKYAWKAIDRKTVRMILGHGSLRSWVATGGHRFERFVEREGLKVQRRLWGRKRADEPGRARLSESDGS